ncbi:hypothetical protein FUA23_15975 [Neolewinella aurantiaca]|uniref:Cytochrome C Planctomycete-type domain-containing protein n=1 Tax=Neolewinella aurantiaca TaxID=2602767 RepID=A0A5C7FL94_9BACT|nr:c-type cytochrome domain-containing protein [Neolewinella aurantiaca]TXF88138.1 hypothetical protein FUA23_15975 [Neolewinella aurantiaca]
MQTVFLADFGLFLGRFHPLLVHLPIGFLLLAVLLEWWPGDKVRPAIRVSWAVGALSAIAAAFCGWLLSGESGGGDALFWHKWLGISVAVLAVAGTYLTWNGGKIAKGIGFVVAGLLSVAGHQGGNLTHGEDYLFEHAPAVVQTIAGHEPKASASQDWSTVNVDSINIYSSFLQPALNKSCTKCHNAGKQNGGLRLDAPSYAFAGGDGGEIIHPGDPLGSSWYKRITLPRNNVKAMPPQGTPLDFSQVRLLEFWIATGADTLALLDPKTTPEDIKMLLARDYGLDLSPKLFVEKIIAPALSAQDIEALSAINWSITPLVPGGPALEVKPKPGKSIDAASLAKLAELAPTQVAYLSLDQLPLTDNDLTPLANFKNLNRLRLNGTKVTAKTVGILSKLPHLESLNLYGTEVDDEVFAHLQLFPSLKRLYLWQTKVTPEATEAYASANPTVSVDTGFTFAPVSEQKSK